MSLLTIKDLWVEVGGRKVLQGVDLAIEEGEVVAIVGPNGGGKSSLAMTLAGVEDYRVIRGEIRWREKEIQKWPMEKRAREGMIMAWQQPVAVPGITLRELGDKVGKRELSGEAVGLTDKLCEREVNGGFSGGERKLSELWQVARMMPKLVILDELEAGLDPIRRQRLGQIVKEQLCQYGAAVLMITHQEEMLNQLKPKRVGVMLEGELKCWQDDWQRVWQTIKEEGYEQCARCRLRAN